MPLLASIWLAGAAGLSWWMEASTNVARRSPVNELPQAGTLKRLVNAMVVVVLALTISATGGIRTPSIWQDRTSLRDASWHLGETVLLDAAGEYQPEVVPLITDDAGIIRPDPPSDELDENGQPLPQDDLLTRMNRLVVDPFDVSSPLADISKPTCVVYGFGEPAVLGHLHAAGLNVAPVQDVVFEPASLNGVALPTYLIIGPNALRTPNLMNDWAIAQYRFDHVADFHFAPSDVVLFNLFSPVWVSQHVEVYVQKLELYRLKLE